MEFCMLRKEEWVGVCLSDLGGEFTFVSEKCIVFIIKVFS